MGGRLGLVDIVADRIEIWFTVRLLNAQTSQDDRRSYPRLAQEELERSVGPVQDLSVTGMRVMCVRVPTEQFEANLDDPEGSVAVKGEVAWSRRVSIRKHEVGVRFLDVTPELVRALSRVSFNHRMRRSMGDELD